MTSKDVAVKFVATRSVANNDSDEPPATNLKQMTIVEQSRTNSNSDSVIGFESIKIRVVYFFYRFSNASLVPFMSLYMEHKGLTSHQIGSLQAIRPIVTLLCGPMWGSLSDRCGKKKLVLSLLYVSSVLFRLCIRFIGGNVKGFACALCASSMFYSAVPSILDSIVVSSMPEHDRHNFGRLRLWGELGNGVASSVMMRLINSKSYGFEYLFIVHSIAAFVALISLILFLPESSSTVSSLHRNDAVTKNTPTVQWRDGLCVIFGDIKLLALFGLVILTGYTMGFIENFCYINLRQIYTENGQFDRFGIDSLVCRVFFSLGGIVAWFFSGSWGKRFGPDAVMVTSVCCLPVCFFLYAGLNLKLNFWTKTGFFVAEAIRSGVYAALWSTATVRVSKLSPPHIKSTVQTMMESSYRGFGHTSGAFFGGMLCRKYGLVSDAFRAAGKGLFSFLILAGTTLFMLRNKQLD